MQCRALEILNYPQKTIRNAILRLFIICNTVSVQLVSALNVRSRAILTLYPHLCLGTQLASRFAMSQKSRG